MVNLNHSHTFTWPKQKNWFGGYQSIFLVDFKVFLAKKGRINLQGVSKFTHVAFGHGVSVRSCTLKRWTHAHEGLQFLLTLSYTYTCT